MQHFTKECALYFVINRAIFESKPRLEKFGDSMNPSGPHELRIAQAWGDSEGKWDAKILKDKLSSVEKKKFGITKEEDGFRSRKVASDILKRLQSAPGKNRLLFVHGFNNNVEAVLDRAEKLGDLYGVEVVPFTWPANGGGAKGVVSYKSDKQDARASVGAFNRVLEKTRELLEDINRKRLAAIRLQARAEFRSDREAQDRFFVEQSQLGCPFKVSLLCHSMGNYLLKQFMSSSIYDGGRLLFDNVVLAAADTNNKGHAEWVDKINSRRRTYVVINEDDSALLASRVKSGDAQLARLGHYTRGLNAAHAVYVDFTDAPDMHDSHAYFEDVPVASRSGEVYDFFNEALNGGRAEHGLHFHASENVYRAS